MWPNTVHINAPWGRSHHHMQTHTNSEGTDVNTNTKSPKHNLTCKSTDYSLSLLRSSLFHQWLCTIYHDGPWTAAELFFPICCKAVASPAAHPRCWPIGCGLLSAQPVNSERLNRSTPGLIIKFPLNKTSCKTPWVGRLQIFKWWGMFAKFCRPPEPDPIMGTSTYFMTDFRQHSSRQGPEALLRLRWMTLPSLIWLL